VGRHLRGLSVVAAIPAGIPLFHQSSCRSA
jgi:hypothetical protein